MKDKGFIDGLIKVAAEKFSELGHEIGNEAKTKIRDMAIEVGNEALDTLKSRSTEFLRRSSGKSGTGACGEVPDSGEQSATSHRAAEVPETRQPQKGVISNEMTEAEEQAFLARLSTEFLKSSLNNVSTPQGALEAVRNYVNTAGDVVKFCELQKTKRAAIESEKLQALAYIDAQKTFLICYMEKTFDERKLQFEQYFRVVDDALLKGNTDQLMLGLNSINGLAATSPFRNLASVQAALNDKNTVWEF